MYLYFSHLSLFFYFSSHLIININHKKNLMVLGLFGYYPWHDGAWDYFLDLGLENLVYLGDLVILSDYFVWSSWGLLQDIGLFVCFLCGWLWLHTLFVIWNSPVYSRYFAHFFEDLIHLKFGYHKRSSIFACLVSIKRMNIK